MPCPVALYIEVNRLYQEGKIEKLEYENLQQLLILMSDDIVEKQVEKYRKKKGDIKCIT